MKRMFCLGAVALAFFSLVTPTNAKAQSVAEDGLAPTIERLSSDPNANPFELGMLQTLRAIEQTLQTRYEYGLGQRVPLLPVLRISGALTPNPNPKPADAGTLTEIMRQFVADMETARTTLLSADKNDVTAFDLTLQDLWFDVDLNRQRTPNENVTDLLGALVIGGRAYSQFSRSQEEDAPISVRFDTADHAWLVAYTHMLSGFGHLFLAFDPEPVFENLASQKAALGNAPEIPNIYDQEDLKEQLAALEAEEAELRSRTEELQETFNAQREELRALQTKAREASEGPEKDELQAAADALQEENRAMGQDLSSLRRSMNFIRNEKQAIAAKQPDAVGQMQSIAAQQAETVDFIYVLIRSLDQQPDADHIRAVRDNWLSMIAQNRRFWTTLAEETDNEREWIPNTTQTSALPVEIPDGAPEAWQTILTDVEAVLKGELLITHPLLPPGHGISVPAYVDDPSPLSLLEWVHGIGAYRYAAKGPRITSQSWNAFQRLTNGNPGGFAIFFN